MVQILFTSAMSDLQLYLSILGKHSKLSGSYFCRMNQEHQFTGKRQSTLSTVQNGDILMFIIIFFLTFKC